MATQWNGRAAALRQQPDSASQTIAAALERISASMLAEVSAAAVVDQPAAVVDTPVQADNVDLWRDHLAACQPYRCSRSGVMFNEGEIMDRLRERLQARIDGRPIPSHSDRHISTVTAAHHAPVYAPPAEILPFTMGAQTDMFGMLS